MTPKEKASELIVNYQLKCKLLDYQQAKQCALIAVDEILKSSPLEPNFADWDDCGGEFRYWYDAQKMQALHYWQEVKKIIENL